MTFCYVNKPNGIHLSPQKNNDHTLNFQNGKNRKLSPDLSIRVYIFNLFMHWFQFSVAFANITFDSNWKPNRKLFNWKHFIPIIRIQMFKF